MLRRVLTPAVLPLLVLAIVPLTASAALAKDGWGAVDCSATPTAPGCEITAGRPGGHDGSSANNAGDPAGDSTGDGSDDGPCYYEAVDSNRPAPPGRNSNGGWYVQVCPFGSGGSSRSEAIWLDAAPPAIRPETLAQQARKMLRLPAVLIQLNPTGDQLVSLPTWLSLAGSSWESRSATASVPGVSVTATARPVRAVWSMGDGKSVTCAGRGALWRPGTDPVRASPDCGYTYRRSSSGVSGAAFRVRVTVVWSVSWVGAGRSGTVPGLTTVGAVSVRVRESQALVTG